MIERITGGLGNLLFSLSIVLFSFLLYLPIFFIPLPFISSVAGLIFLSFTIYSLSRELEDKKILGLYIKGLIVFAVGISSIIFVVYITNHFFENINLGEQELNILSFIVAIGLVMVLWVVSIISSIFYRSSIKEINKYFFNSYLKWGSNLLVLGSILSIFIIGIPILAVAFFILGLGFFSMKVGEKIEIEEG